MQSSAIMYIRVCEWVRMRASACVSACVCECVFALWGGALGVAGSGVLFRG